MLMDARWDEVSEAVVVERGLEHLWDCFERKKITTWSAMGLVL